MKTAGVIVAGYALGCAAWFWYTDPFMRRDRTFEKLMGYPPRLPRYRPE